MAADKPQRVRALFAAIAPRYDLNNRLHSLWLDQSWRRATVRASAVRPGEAVLDVATGTGDLARLFARAKAGRVVGLDFCAEMLAVARQRFADSGVEWVLGDALALPFADNSFDVAAISFGVRNVADPYRALAEMHRVLRPGGRAVVLEFDRPRGGPGALLWFYLTRVLPWSAAALAGERVGAYRYLARSVATFLSADGLAAAMRAVGLAGVTSRPLALGAVVLHVGGRA